DRALTPTTAVRRPSSRSGSVPPVEGAARVVHPRAPLKRGVARDGKTAAPALYSTDSMRSGSSTMADGTTPIVPETPAEAVTPAGINHLVINVRDIEESHKFWTETLGFKQVGYSKRRNGKMRFYSGDHDGRMNHHDIALCENPNLPKPPAEWAMF